MSSCIFRPYSRLDAKNFHPFPDLLVSRNFISVAVSCLYGKWYPILNEHALISIPYRRLNCSKTLPFSAAHTYIPYIRGVLPRDGRGTGGGKSEGGKRNSQGSRNQEKLRIFAIERDKEAGTATKGSGNREKKERGEGQSDSPVLPHKALQSFAENNICFAPIRTYFHFFTNSPGMLTISVWVCRVPYRNPQLSHHHRHLSQTAIHQNHPQLRNSTPRLLQPFSMGNNMSRNRQFHHEVTRERTYLGNTGNQSVL